LATPNRADFWILVKMEFYNPQRPEVEEACKRRLIGTRKNPFPSPDANLAKGWISQILESHSWQTI
jgi:hypothetical protein